MNYFFNIHVVTVQYVCVRKRTLCFGTPKPIFCLGCTDMLRVSHFQRTLISRTNFRMRTIIPSTPGFIPVCSPTCCNFHPRHQTSCPISFLSIHMSHRLGNTLITDWLVVTPLCLPDQYINRTPRLPETYYTPQR